MAFRVLSYMVNILALQRREWEANNVPENERRYAPVIPIVFYTGEQRWNAPLALDALMDGPDVLSRIYSEIQNPTFGRKGNSPRYVMV